MTAPTCESCSAGTYSSGVGSVLSCTSCPLNAISAVGASVCVPASRYYDLGASLLAYYPFNPGQMLMDILSSRLGSLTTPQAAPIADCKTADAGPGGAWASNCVSARQANAALRFVNSSAQYLSLPSVVLPVAYSVCLWYQAVPYRGSPNPWEVLFQFIHTSTDVSYSLIFQRSFQSSSVAVLTSNVYTGGDWTLNWSPYPYMADQTWYHLCSTFHGSDYNFFINGASIASGTMAAQDATQMRTVNTLFGCVYDRCFQGKIDEFRLFGKALTAAEVAAVYGFRGRRGDTYTPVLPVQCFAISGTCLATYAADGSGSAALASVSLGAILRVVVGHVALAAAVIFLYLNRIYLLANLRELIRPSAATTNVLVSP